jgi:hypothetical protein
MTKAKLKSSNQLSLFDLVKQSVEKIAAPAMGSLDIDAEFRAALSEDIKGCPQSRYQIAARMSELLGREITKSQLDNWTAESHEPHRMPAQYLAAFVLATGGRRRAMETVARHAGIFALPGPEALRAEMQRIDDIIAELRQEKRKAAVLISVVEGRRR